VNFIDNFWCLRQDWISIVKGQEDTLNLLPTLPHTVVVASQEDVVAVVETQVTVVVVISLGTSFLPVNSTAEPIIQYSRAISGLIQRTWEKRKVLILQISMV
jgi:hypothetical protein